MSAGYFTLMNHGSQTVTLTQIVSDSVDVQMHTTIAEDAGTTMRPLPSVEINSDSQVVFQPGGKHLMIRNLSEDATSVPMTMIFANGETLETTFFVIPMQEWMDKSTEGKHEH